MRFEVEYVDRDGAYAFAKQLDAGVFQLGPGATLGRRKIEPWIIQPRALDGKADRARCCFMHGEAGTLVLGDPLLRRTTVSPAGRMRASRVLRPSHHPHVTTGRHSRPEAL